MRDCESTSSLVKKLALMIAAVVCFMLFIASIFNYGRVALFGVPVSGLVFGILMREILRKIDP